MAIITVTSDNIDKEHICCAISDKKGENRVSSKKAWLKERFVNGKFETNEILTEKTFLKILESKGM